MGTKKQKIQSSITKSELMERVRLRREPTDTEMLDWLAQQVFYPRDTPTNGVFACVSEEYAPNGKFTGDPQNDARNFRVAIMQAMFA